MKVFKKAAIALLVIVLPIALPIGAVRVWSSPGWASLLVRLQREKFDAAADAALAGAEVSLPFGVSDYSSAQVVNFDLGAWGLGAETSYWGVYRSTFPAAVPIVGDIALTPGGDGWSWHEARGDNEYITQAIAGGWWYWRAWF